MMMVTVMAVMMVMIMIRIKQDSPLFSMKLLHMTSHKNTSANKWTDKPTE